MKLKLIIFSVIFQLYVDFRSPKSYPMILRLEILQSNSKMRVIALLCLLGLALSQSAPTLPPQFSIDFTQTAKLVTTGTTKGSIYYDAPGNRQVVTRQNGKHDRYCGTVFKVTDTPCRHIIVNNKRFLDFPAKQYCCFCCDSSHGCGILLPDWLVKAGAVNQGTQQLDQNGPYQKWYIKGLQDNYFYNKADSLNTPRRLYQVPDDDMNFSNYRVGKPDDKNFQLPNYCTEKCGLTTVCAGLRGEYVQ